MNKAWVAGNWQTWCVKELRALRSITRAAEDLKTDCVGAERCVHGWLLVFRMPIRRAGLRRARCARQRGSYALGDVSGTSRVCTRRNGEGKTAATIK